ncbi:hypothetical protein V8E36_000489 [Tilletia maclaganii]
MPTTASTVIADRIHKPRTWITLWLAISSIVVLWDCGYMLLRPHSMKGGKWFALWAPYELYASVDKEYAIEAYYANEGFPPAQSIMSLPETALNFIYVYLVTISTSQQGRAIAPIIGLTATVMTAAKTILFFLVDWACGYCKTGHNGMFKWVVIYVMPNSPWVFFPTAIALTLGFEIAGKLRAAAGLPAVSFPSRAAIKTSKAN